MEKNKIQLVDNKKSLILLSQISKKKNTNHSKNITTMPKQQPTILKICLDFTLLLFHQVLTFAQHCANFSFNFFHNFNFIFILFIII